ncbi:hypothetical protein EKO23_07795 [Nocardioides guangzhouensis]|uniref:Uncharacterized protein n=1 Tax=Nocardioides guangzhouensis TaxID=2497878 RepID=A0A4Q4ZFH9_9ACTN|nr:hypothetical protein [Nocardioides guangzhouensis]RYP86867.1 hypothetical protein EKO23_07795 [Nocardioides guangzhouensis]
MTMHITTVDTTDTRQPTPPIGQDPTGPIWVEVRPDLRRLHVLAGDVLATLGKRRDIAGKGRNEHEDIHHAEAWLHAHRTADLVLTQTQRLHPKILAGACDLAANAGVQRLWLLHAPPRSDAFDHTLSRRATGTAIVDAVPTPEMRDRTAPEPAAIPLPAVPQIEFTTFWAACQDQLSAQDLTLVGDRLARTVAACTAGLTRTGATEDTVADLALGLLNHAPADAELAVDIRALQIAAWHHDLYVKVNHTRLHQHEERPRQAQEDVDAAMLAYRQPYRALTTALTRQGFGVADIATIAIAYTDPDAGCLDCLDSTISLTPAAATALRAQLYLRRSHGAADHDPLLPHTPKALAKALTDAQTDLAVHVHGRRAERTRNHTTRALRQLGITLHALP